MITAANKFIFDAVAIAIDDDEEESSSIVATEIPHQLNANLLFIFPFLSLLHLDSVDTFKLYVQSLDSSPSSAANQQQPPKPKRSEPISVPAEDDAAFDTSYVDKVIFRTGGEDFPSVEEEEEEVFALDPAFASFRSEVSVGVAEIDSGLQSPDNAYGSSLRPGRPDFLQLSSFMIWNDPDAPNNSTGGASTSVSPSASSSQLNASNQNSANQQNLRLPGAHKSTFGQLAVSPTESPLSSPEPQPQPQPQSSAALNTSNTSSAGKTMRRRGLFSWNTSNAQLQNSGGGHSEPAQLEVNLSGTSEKSPKSPTTTTNGGGNMGGSVVSLHSNSATTSGSSGAGPQLGTQLEDEDRFNGDGVQFHGKLIGSEYVAEARGEQMCQQSLKKLKVSCFFLGKQFLCFSIERKNENHTLISQNKRSWLVVSANDT